MINPFNPQLLQMLAKMPNKAATQNALGMRPPMQTPMMQQQQAQAAQAAQAAQQPFPGPQEAPNGMRGGMSVSQFIDPMQASNITPEQKARLIEILKTSQML